jgi:hypothetical protein
MECTDCLQSGWIGSTPMKPEPYQALTRKLVANLEGDPRVIGLVALGSMAQQDYVPDRWSDHDFFVITQPGEQEHFRTATDWLPDAGDLVLHFRETAHGVKALYRSSHLLEFAVFDLTELSLARINRWRVLLDHGGVTHAVAAIAEDTARSAADRPLDVSRTFGQFLTHLLVGVGRARRGERLSASQMIKTYATADLIQLWVNFLPAANASLLDNLDPLRRFEQIYPELGGELNAAMLQPPEECAQTLLGIAERRLAATLGAGFPAAAVETVRAFLQPDPEVDGSGKMT